MIEASHSGLVMVAVAIVCTTTRFCAALMPSISANFLRESERAPSGV